MVAWLSGFGVALCLLQGLLLLVTFPRLRVAWSYAALMAVVATFFLHPFTEGGLNWLTQSLRTAIPGVFCWLCIEAFTDRANRFARVSWIIAYTIIAPALYYALFPDSPHGSLLQAAMVRLPQWCEYGLLVFGLGLVVGHWRDDLVQSRRWLRGGVLIVTGSVILLQVVLEQWVEQAQVAKFLLADLALVVVAVTLLTGRSGILLGASVAIPKPMTELAEPATSPQLQGIERAIDQKRYQQAGLTLAMFARELNLPEYRLRQLINRQLGFRNFPDFVNHYRIREARQRLTDEPDEPITNIALDLGFRSVSSFNRVFKEQVGCAPGSFRRAQGLAETRRTGAYGEA